jgi:hypothetical protein
MEQQGPGGQDELPALRFKKPISSYNKKKNTGKTSELAGNSRNCI